MFCQLCGKSIGTFRRFVDRDYCCAAHRTESVRQFSEDDEQDAPLPEAAERLRQGLRTALTLVGAVSLVMCIGVLSFSNVMASGRRSSSSAGRNWFASSARGVAPTTLTDEFREMGPEWIPGTVHSAAGIRDQLGAGEWRMSARGVEPGSLYLWKPTLDLRDYELTFQATIGEGGVGWAFRAADAGTLYGAKLLLRSDGPDSSGCLQRFLRVNGLQSERVCEAQPVMLDRGVPYTVRVLVSADEFTVYLNGVWLAAWKDARLAQGGVGFFVESGERAIIHSAAISERDSMLGRLAGYFSLIGSPLRLAR